MVPGGTAVEPVPRCAPSLLCGFKFPHLDECDCRSTGFDVDGFRRADGVLMVSMTERSTAMVLFIGDKKKILCVYSNGPLNLSQGIDPTHPNPWVHSKTFAARPA